MKKILSLLVLAALLLAILPGTASAASGFSDVPSGSWYEQAVIWATNKGITTGIGDGKFGPNLYVSRGQVVTMLWRMEGGPKASGNGGFTDVKTGTWYTEAVVWAAKNSIVNGYPGNLFVPDRKISRQELVTILFRYAKYKNKNVKVPNTNLSVYTDAGNISSFALDPMRWAVGNEIVSGTTGNTLSPIGTATRAQFVQMLYRWLGSSSGSGWELPFIPTP